jgi:hypothetical protein
MWARKISHSAPPIKVEPQVSDDFCGFGHSAIECLRATLTQINFLELLAKRSLYSYLDGGPVFRQGG